MDAKVLKMYDVTMRLNSFVIAANKGQDIVGPQLAKTKNLYTHKGAPMTTNKIKEFLAIFKDARSSADAFYENYRIVEKDRGGASPIMQARSPKS